MNFYEKLGLMLIMAIFTSDVNSPIMGILLAITMVLFIFGKDIEDWSKSKKVQ